MLDGRQYSGVTYNSAAGFTPALRIGYDANQGYAACEFSNVALFIDRALTPPEIQLLYNQPLCMIDDGVEVWSPAAAITRRPIGIGGPMAGTLTPLAV